MTSRFWASGGSALTLARGFRLDASGAGAGALINAPTYALSTASGVSPTSWNVTGDSTFQPGMYVHQQFAVSGTSFATPVPGAPSVDYYTQIEGSNWEAASSTIGNGLVTFVQPTGTYDTRCRFETVPGDSTNNVVSAWSNTVTDTIAAPLILNGTFTDTSAWTLGSGVTISGGVCNASSAGAICQQPVTYVSGGTYQLDFDYQSSSGGGSGKLRANLSSTNGADIVATSSTLTFDFATHHITLTFTANVTSGFMSIEADTAAYSGWIDNVTLVRTA